MYVRYIIIKGRTENEFHTKSYLNFINGLDSGLIREILTNYGSKSCRYLVSCLQTLSMCFTC